MTWLFRENEIEILIDIKKRKHRINGAFSFIDIVILYDYKNSKQNYRHSLCFQLQTIKYINSNNVIINHPTMHPTAFMYINSNFGLRNFNSLFELMFNWYKVLLDLNFM